MSSFGFRFVARAQSIQKWHVFVMAAPSPLGPQAWEVFKSSNVVLLSLLLLLLWCCCCRWRPCQRSFCVCLEYITHFWLFTTTSRNNKLCEKPLPRQRPARHLAISVSVSGAAVFVTCKICAWSSEIPDTTASPVTRVQLLFRQPKPSKSSLKLHLLSGARSLE